MANARSRIACTDETHEKLKEVKRDGETFDTLLRQMLAQYDPSEAP